MVGEELLFSQLLPTDWGLEEVFGACGCAELLPEADVALGCVGGVWFK